MLDEFKKFALRGNAVDLAIGVIIGAAFSRIVESIVGDLFTPMISAIAGGLDFSNYFVPLSSEVTAQSLAEARKQGAVLAWGNFLTVFINFLIVAAILFFVVKAINRLKFLEDMKIGALKQPEVPADVKLLAEIRDILASGSGDRPSGAPTEGSRPR